MKFLTNVDELFWKFFHQSEINDNLTLLFNEIEKLSKEPKVGGHSLGPVTTISGVDFFWPIQKKNV